MNSPSFQFYPGDWKRDVALQSCCLSARGLWLEILCLMHQGEPYGHLRVGGKRIETKTLARMVGEQLRNIRRWLKELEDAQVFSVTKDGVIFSRRMVNDERLRKVRAAGGKLGGNPNLMANTKDNIKVDGEVGDKVNLQANLQPTPASASASAKKKKLPTGVKKARASRATPPPEFFEITPEVQEEYRSLMESGEAPPGLNLQHEAARMLDYCRENGIIKADWRARYRNWLRMAGKFAGNGKSSLNHSRVGAESEHKGRMIEVGSKEHQELLVRIAEVKL